MQQCSPGTWSRTFTAVLYINFIFGCLQSLLALSDPPLPSHDELAELGLVRDAAAAKIQVCDAMPIARVPDADFKFGSLHDVVGRDGVMVISLLRKPFRFEHSAALLRQAGIWPTEFPAAEAPCLQKEELDAVCPLESNYEIAQSSCQSKSGSGCRSTTEQAIAESHRRALVAAEKRPSNWDWTAILEEDVVPVRPERWNSAFRQAWEKVPEGIKIVRLSWCNFPGDHPGYSMASDTHSDAGEFRLVNWTGYHPAGSEVPPGRKYNSGGCTGGYMVHRSIIPKLLGLFPCCCALDCCLQYDFFGRSPEGGEATDQEKTLGTKIMLGIDAWGSVEYAMNYTFWGLYQSGVLVQDARENPSTREDIEPFTWSPVDQAWHLTPEFAEYDLTGEVK